MGSSTLKNHFLEYARRMAEIRRLSSPDIKVFDNAEDYSERLRSNFERIGYLSAENKRMLDEELYPLLGEDSELGKVELKCMNELSDLLLNMAGTEDFENLDLPVTSLVSERLLKDAKESDDLNELIRQLHREIAVCYSLMNMTQRIYTNLQISNAYREKGVEIARMFFVLLRKDRFLKITDMECREMVMTNARFSAVFYENVREGGRDSTDNLDILDRLLKLMYDQFYRDALPDYDWIYFKFRALEHYIQCTENCNARGFDSARLERICNRADEMERFCSEFSYTLSDYIGYDFIPVCIARCRYLAGRLSKEDYRRLLEAAYFNRNKSDFESDGNLYNILVPLEIIGLIDRKMYTAQDAFLLEDIYRNLCAYIFHMPNTGGLSYFMEYYEAIIRDYIEIPSGLSFMDFMLQCLAALHPPTYIHSVMVGRLSECMCRHLIESRPDLFIGVLGCGSASEVRERAADIIAFTYNAAICHDFGKVNIFDTIFVYGRRLLDFEFNIIKSHPEMGYDLLSAHASTRAYAPVALGHHRWYDDSKGYPESFNTSGSDIKVIIDLVQCADCMDAATDSVGRSYNRGKRLSDFLQEISEGAGTRYAPWLVDLFDSRELRSDIEYLLTGGRARQYRETYNLLKDVQDNG